MARATRSSTADLKRKRSLDADHSDHGPKKLQRTDHPIHAHALLPVLEPEDPHGLLDRVFPLPDLDSSASLRSLLATHTPLHTLYAAVHQLMPISSVPRAILSPTAQQQLRFCNLALDLLKQLSPPESLDHPAVLPEADSESSPPNRPAPSYALVQHLPSADYWSSLLHTDQLPQNLNTANAELVAILPAPSSSKESSVPTLASYSTKPLSQKKPPLAQRRVTTAAFLDYGLYTSFAPTFDHDGEVVGKDELSQVLWQREQKKRLTESLRRERLEGVGSVVDINAEPTSQPPHQDQSSSLDLELDSLLAPEDVEAIKSALNSLELEKSVQNLLDRNQRALERLEELQYQRLTKHPTSNAEEDSEEWETAQAILDSLTVLASLRPRSSTESSSAIIPPPSLIHKLHLTLSIEPSPGWYGTLPAGRTTALRDDSTVKVRPGAVIPTPATSTPSTPASTANTTNLGAYSYGYTSQGYRPPQQTGSYTPYKPAQPTPSYYQGYTMGGQQQTYYPQQSYATGTTNQQPYGAQQQQQQPQPQQQQTYTGNFSWYGQPYPMAQSGSGSGRGTPQPAISAPASVATSYGSFFSATAAAASTTRTPAIANTVIASAGSGLNASVPTPTLPTLVRTPPIVNGSSALHTPYYASYASQTQPAR